MAVVSVLLPAFNEADGLALAVQTIENHLAPLRHEVRFVVVDDGSTDRTWAVICALAREKPYVSGISFSRNFGKEAAVAAGLEHCDGDCVIVLDADLQHPPEALPRLLHAWEEGGYQIVHGVKRQRSGESRFRRACSRLIFSLAKTLSGLDLQRSSDYKLLDREVVQRYCEFRERQLFFRGLVDWLGFKSTQIEFDVAPRAAGVSKWGLWGLARYAVNAIISFTTMPLKIVAGLAVLFLGVSTLIGLKTLFDWASGRSAEGFPTVIVLTVGFGNVVMAAVSVISWYVGKIYDEVKQRPRYVVAHSTGPLARMQNAEFGMRRAQ
jgi:dolichol-phosphate mannosyltransferase